MSKLNLYQKYQRTKFSKKKVLVFAISFAIIPCSFSPSLHMNHRLRLIALEIYINLKNCFKTQR